MAGGAQDTGGTLIGPLAISAAMLLMGVPLAAATVRGTVTIDRVPLRRVLERDDGAVFIMGKFGSGQVAYRSLNKTHTDDFDCNVTDVNGAFACRNPTPISYL
ncbi:MAG: hypothetical protein JWO97_3903 [Acidobacteria bacterium]|nr:hypothetical protein [Acidobacteriota bacterium]